MKRYSYNSMLNEGKVEEKRRYKMYKKGKMWLVAGISIFTGSMYAVSGTASAATDEASVTSASSFATKSETDKKAAATETATASNIQPVASYDEVTQTPVTTSNVAESVTDDQEVTDQEATTEEKKANEKQADSVETPEVTTDDSEAQAVQAISENEEATEIESAYSESAATDLLSQADELQNKIADTVAEGNALADAFADDNIPTDAALNALGKHAIQEKDQVKDLIAAAQAASTTNLDQANELMGNAMAIVNNMAKEFEQAGFLLNSDKNGVDANVLANAQEAMTKVSLPEGVTAELSAYGDLIITASSTAVYEQVLNSLIGTGLSSSFRSIVDPAPENISAKVKDFTATDLADAKAKLTSVELEAGLNVPTDFTEADFDWSGVEDKYGEYDVKLTESGIQKIMAANTDKTLEASAVTAGKLKLTGIKPKVGNVSGQTAAEVKTKVPTVDLGAAGLITPTFTADDFDWNQVQDAAGDYEVKLNATGIQKIKDSNAGVTFTEADITAGQATVAGNAATLKVTVGDVTGTSKAEVITKVPEVKATDATATINIPSTLTKDDFDWSQVQDAQGEYPITLNETGIQKIKDANQGAELIASDITVCKAKIEANASSSSLKVTVGNVTGKNKAEVITKVPEVKATDATATINIPSTLTKDDFDWSHVQDAPGNYEVTLNATGIQKIKDANQGAELEASDITVGQATIKAGKITVGVVNGKTADEAKSRIPAVDLGDANLTTPRFTVDDFDWSKVENKYGVYEVTLNQTGIDKIIAANPGMTIDPATDIKVGNATVTTIKVTIGDVSGRTKDEVIAKIPEIKSTDSTVTLTIPTTLTKDDFDWSAVQDSNGTYDIKLKQSGMQKIMDANLESTLDVADITTGQAKVDATASSSSLKVTVGNVTGKNKAEVITKVPTVKATNSTATITIPTTLTKDDFDWSKVQEAPGDYEVTLNATGIQKIKDANQGAELTASDITVGKATVTTATKVKVTVGNVTGTTAADVKTKVPDVTLGDTSLLKPTFTADDFDWSQVREADGSYDVTLNEAGIQKIIAANSTKNITVDQIDAGQANVKANAGQGNTITATVGSVSGISAADVKTKVPSVTLIGTGLTTPTFVASDFDWSDVKEANGTYKVTLNEAGIKKITDANAGKTLASADIIVGRATVNAQVKALNVTVGDVEGSSASNVKTKIPPITLGGANGLIIPKFTIEDFDWSKVQDANGSYEVTLNASGIAKILSANPNTTLDVANVKAGKAKVNTALAPTQITATVGAVTGTSLADAKTKVPSVTLNGKAGLVVPTLTASDFNWSPTANTDGTYAVTLNDSGIKKIMDANKSANISLLPTAVTAGKATVTAGTQKVVVQLVDQNGKPLKNSSGQSSYTLTGNPNDLINYSGVNKTVAGYKLVTDGTKTTTRYNADGTAEQVVKLVYAKDATSKDDGASTDGLNGTDFGGNGSMSDMSDDVDDGFTDEAQLPTGYGTGYPTHTASGNGFTNRYGSMLPQTGETNESAAAWIGVSLAAVIATIGTAGYRRRKEG